MRYNNLKKELQTESSMFYHRNKIIMFCKYGSFICFLLIFGISLYVFMAMVLSRGFFA